MRTFLTAVALTTTLLGAGCRTAANAGTRPSPARVLVAERLFFGRTVPSGGTVSDADWQAFLRDFVTPRFPEGLTVVNGNGQWRDARGRIWAEDSFVLEVFREPGADLEKALGEIANEYKSRFHQDAVLRVTSPAAVRFY